MTSLRLSGCDSNLFRNFKSGNLENTLANIVTLELDDRFHSSIVRKALEIGDLTGRLTSLRHLSIRSFGIGYNWGDKDNAERYR